MSTRFCFSCLAVIQMLTGVSLIGAEVPVVTAEPQPFLAATRQVMEAKAFLGSAFTAEEMAALQQCIQQNDADAVEKAQRILDARTLFLVTINPEQRVKVVATQSLPKLDEAGWHSYLVKVVNEAGTTASASFC